MGAIVGGANAQQAKLAAADFVIRNVTARGGLQAWCAVQTLSVSGKMEAEGNNLPALPMPGLRRIQRITRPRSSAQAELPFSVQMKRTRKLRVELDFDGRTAVQIHDGRSGSVMRPYLEVPMLVAPAAGRELRDSSLVSLEL